MLQTALVLLDDAPETFTEEVMTWLGAVDSKASPNLYDGASGCRSAR